MIVRDKDFCSMICTKCHCVNFFLVLFVRRVILKVTVVWEELLTQVVTGERVEGERVRERVNLDA